jgi:signal transduction histidine kinase
MAEPVEMASHGLNVIMRSAMRGVRGDFALVAVKIDHERLLVQAGLGPLAEDMVGNLMPMSESVAAPVFLTGHPLLIPDYPREGAADEQIRRHIGSVVIVPLIVDRRVEGALAVGRLSGRECFLDSELDAMSAFIQRTGTARELEQMHEERRTARLIEDRARLYADLHDNVIQELFAAGMTLDSVARSMADEVQRNQVLAQVDALDATMTRIRGLISDVPGSAYGVRSLPLPKQVVAIVDSLTPALRCLPTVMFVGPVDSSARNGLAKDVEAVLREGLSNVARHAAATAVQVRLSALDDELVIEIIDNGRGFGNPTRRSGVRNMGLRAGRHNGHVRFTTPEGGGTHLRWSALVPGRHGEPTR